MVKIAVKSGAKTPLFLCLTRCKSPILCEKMPRKKGGYVLIRWARRAEKPWGGG